MSIAEGRRPAGLRGLVPVLLLLLLLGGCLEEAEDKCFVFNGADDPTATECVGGEGSSGTFGNVVIVDVNTIGEVVLLFNQGTLDEPMTGWKLENSSTPALSDEFTFPTFTLPIGTFVRVHSLTGTDTATDLFWDGVTTHWGPTGEALLSDDSGNPVDSCADTDPCWN